MLTPPMCWHGHINQSGRRTVWFDAANMPAICALDASFFEPGTRQDERFWEVSDAGSEEYRFRERNTQRSIHCRGTDGARAMRYTKNGGSVMPTLDLSSRRSRRQDQAEAGDLQRDLPGRLRRGRSTSASTRSSGRGTTSSPCRTGPGRATKRARRSFSSSPTARSTSDWTSCAKSWGDRPPVRRVEDFASSPARPLHRRSFVSRHAPLRAGAIAHPHARIRKSLFRKNSRPYGPRHGEGRRRPMRAAGDPRHGGAAALGARARNGAPRRRAGRCGLCGKQIARRRCGRAGPN